jgi:sugar phosphate permease
MLWAPIIRTFTDLLPVGHREKAGTNIAASCSIGAVLAFLIPGFVLKHANWRVVFFISGGLLLTAFLVWVIGNRALSSYVSMMEKSCAAEREALRELAASRSSAKENTTPKGTPPSLLRVFWASGLWVVLFGLVCNGALRDAVESWAPSFLADQFRLDSSMAAITSVIIPVISITGTYFANWLFEKKLKNELVTSCVMFAIAAVCVGGLILCSPLGAVPCALLMAISVSAMWGANHMFLTVIPYRFASLGLSAAITGILNSVIYFATSLCSMLYGFLADRVGWNTLILVWLGIGIFGVIVCLVGSKLWGRKREELNAGRI